MPRFACDAGPGALRLCHLGVTIVAHDFEQACRWAKRHGYFQPTPVPTLPRAMQTTFVLDIRLDEPPTTPVP